MWVAVLLRPPDLPDALIEQPPELQRRTPLVVVHGRKTDPAEILSALRGQAREAGLAVAAPDFRSPSFAGYQFLAGAHGPLASAEALNGLLDQWGQTRGLETARIDLAGFSGGAQFAHRYALAYPERVRRLVLAAPGWYAFLDPEVTYPAGTGGFPWPRGGPCIEAFLEIPTLIVVGSRDTGRGPSLRATSELDAQQGPHRLARAERWCQHLREEAARRGVQSRVELVVLTDLGHNWARIMRSGGFAELALEFVTRGVPVRTGR